MSTSIVSREPSIRCRQRVEIHAHKLAAPVFHAVIPRQALLNRVFASASCRLVLLQGPAGYGKSTTLKQLKSACEANGYLTTWLTLDTADNDLRRCAVYFEALLAVLLEQSGAVMEGDWSDLSLQQRCDRFSNRLFHMNRPIGIFLDEFHCVTDPALLSFFAKLFAKLPTNVRVFAASRTLPAVGLARLLVNNEALIFRAADLRFSPAEAESFLTAEGPDLITPEEINSLYATTDGWPAALQLFKLSRASSRWRGSALQHSSQPRELTEYLADNVLASQDPAIQDFLLRTAPLTQLSAALCDSVTGRNDSHERLAYLEQAGLLIQRSDTPPDAFTHHPLFASFLQGQLIAQSRAMAIEVHRAAAQWHCQQANYADTLHHAIECHDFSLVADTLNAWLPRLIASGQLATVEYWVDRLPIEEVIARMELAIKVAYALVFLRRRQKAEPILTFLEQHRGTGNVGSTTCPDVVLAMAALAADDLEAASSLIDGIEITERRARGFACFEFAVAANLLACRSVSRRQFESSREYLGLACSHNDLASATFSEGYTLAATCIWQILQGELPKAVLRCRDYLDRLRGEQRDSFAAASVAASYLWALYEMNDLEQVQGVFRQYQDVIAVSALPDFLVVAFLSAARAEEALGDSQRAGEILDQLEGMCYRHAWMRLVGVVNWERARRLLAAGAMQDAQAIAVQFSSSRARHWLAFSEDFEGPQWVRIRLAMHCGDFDLAATRLKIELKRKSLSVFTQIKLHQLNALLQHKRRARDPARRALHQALRLAAQGRYVRSFIEEGTELHSLLHEEYQLSSTAAAGLDEKCFGSRQFLRTLLQACNIGSPTSVWRSNPSRQALTTRETSILRFLADGVSNHDIAARIFISQNTVKFHLKNIYSKLGVRNRIQAISSARALGLIGE